MPTLNSHAAAFARGFLRSPAGVGSIIPSSRYLERQIVRSAQLQRASTIVELGPGTGGTTRALLEAMSPHATLICVEIDPYFAALVGDIPDSRLHVHEGSAEHLHSALAARQISSADVIVSGIPFSTMSQDLGRRILRVVQTVLSPEGRFVAYQLRNTVAQLSNPIFGTPDQSELVLRNVPPMRVYQWRSNNAFAPATPSRESEDRTLGTPA